MKVVIKIFTSLLALAATATVVIFVLHKTGFWEENIERTSVFKQEYNGKIYTERKFEWVPEDSDEVIEYTKPYSDTTSITLLLNPVTYYNIDVPNIPVINHFGKSVFAQDGSFGIRVLATYDPDDIGATVGITESENITNDIATNKPGVKGKRTIYTIIDDYLIIVDVYKNSEYYSTFQDSLLKNRKSYTMENDNLYVKEPAYLDDLKYSGEFMEQVILNQIDLEVKEYLFEYGAMYLSSSYFSMSETKDIYLKQLVAFSKNQISEIYEDSGKYYAKAGDWHIGLIAYNTNTTIVLFGYGEEAECNIKQYVRTM